jgi:amino acid transporter
MNRKKVLSLFSLVMINIIAVDSLRSLPIAAVFGTTLITYYLIAAVCFFIPSALVSAELATGWPSTGGIYIWVREAFGKRSGFVVIWLQWVYNIVWYPTICALIAATFTYLFDPSLAQNKTYMFCATLIIYWSATLVNCFGMRLSGWASSLGAIVGTLFPMLLIIGLGLMWWTTGHHLVISFSVEALTPHFSNLNDLVLLLGIVFSLMGLEMSAIHASEVKNPKRDYPWALLISASIILFSLICASLAIAVVIPPEKLDILTGLIDAFSAFFALLHLSWMLPFIVFAIILGSATGVAAWIIGPAKGLMVATQDGSLPPYFSKVTTGGVPFRILMLQGAIVTLLSFIFLLMPTINSSYWLLTDLTAQLALISYLGLFAASIKLRYSQKNTARAFKIPGKNVGIWAVAGLGIITCIATMLLGFFPPTQVAVGGTLCYEFLLIGGILLFVGVPLLLPDFSIKTLNNK